MQKSETTSDQKAMAEVAEPEFKVGSKGKKELAPWSERTYCINIYNIYIQTYIHYIYIHVHIHIDVCVFIGSFGPRKK